MAIHASKEFPGIAFELDPAKNPFFKALVKENLRKLKELPTGKALLKAIADADPEYRSKRLPKGANVLIAPPMDRDFLTPGMKKDGTILDQKKVDGWREGKEGYKLVPTLSSKTQVSADCGKSQGAAKYPKPEGTGGGSTCSLYYTNTEVLSDSGEWFIPHVTMGHELIHCYHALYGLSKWDDKDEEWFTVGIKGFENATFTENKLRGDAKFPLRKKYFKDD